MKINIILLLLILLLFPILSVNGQNKYTVEPGVKNNQIILELSNISRSVSAKNLEVKLIRGINHITFTQTENRIKKIERGTETEASFIFDVSYNIGNIEADTVEFLITDNKTIRLTKQFIFTYTQPKEFRLEQNYPNPFNPTTKIRYAVAQDAKRERSNVVLKVYDILGNEVATLVNEEKPAGYYEVEFNASSLASGVYVYRLTSGNPSTSSGHRFISTKKMMVLK